MTRSSSCGISLHEKPIPHRPRIVRRWRHRVGAYLMREFVTLASAIVAGLMLAYMCGLR